MSDGVPKRVGVDKVEKSGAVSGSGALGKARTHEGTLGETRVFGHFLQSEAWEKYEQAEGHKTLCVEGEGFRAMVVVHETALGKYLFCPYGPELWKVSGHDLKWSLERALNSLSDLAREQQAIFVRVEPTVALSELFPGAAGSEAGFEKEMKRLGLIKSHDLDPAHTWILDLTGGQESLLGGMEKRKVRYWRNYAKRGFSMRQTQNPEEIGALTGLLAKLGERDHFNPQDEQHLKRQLEAGFATLYILEANSDTEGGAGSAGGSEKKVIAAALIYDYDGVRYYAHAAADEAFMRYAPGSIVLIQMILDASQAGMREYDFWGITISEDPKHPWYGFTQYKKSFGGRQVDYAGTWDLPVARRKYQLYQGLRTVNRVMRKKR